MNSYLEILERVRRDSRSLSQIAREAGIPLSTLRYALKAKKGPRLDTMEKLAAYLAAREAA